MKIEFRMRVRTALIAAGLGLVLLGGAGRAQMPPDRLDQLAHTLAAELAKACPAAKPDDAAAYDACARALRGRSDIPFAVSVDWGGEQPSQRLAKKTMTRFHPEVFREMYLVLFSFDGTVTTGHEARDNVDTITLGATFRNALPTGYYPYPFWHSDAKWTDYEHATAVRFYVDPDGMIFAASRPHIGGPDPYAHRQPPSFDGKWLWTDAKGVAQPHVSLFASRYSADNPVLPSLDAAYRDFALALRNGTCMRCHTPVNHAGSSRLVIFQTPLHAAGAIDDMLKSVRENNMPRNDWGVKRVLDPQIRDTLLNQGDAFRAKLHDADAWEMQHHPLAPVK